MKELIVDKKDNKKNLIPYLMDIFPNLSSNLLYKTLRKKDIKINDKRVSTNCHIFCGDIIKIYLADYFFECPIPPIIYEDDNIVIVNKPVGIEVVSDGNEETLTSIMQKYEKENGVLFLEPCHRLDRNTSGLTLFAKNELSLTILLDKFKNHEIEKHYLATVYGIPKKSYDKLEAYLFKDQKKSLVFISDTPKKGYQKIITSYCVIKKDTKLITSILDVQIETGKTHQIRAHLAHIGYPIIGDGKYGNNIINKKFKKKTQMVVIQTV